MKRLGTLFAGIFLIAGCMSSAGEVVARSGQERPAWADGNISNEPSRDVFVAYKKSDVYRLELGVRAAQASGVAEAKKLLLKRVRAELDSFCTKENIVAATIAAQLDAAVLAAGEKMDDPEATAVKVYHEEIKKETSEGARTSYDVYVLLSIPRRYLEEALGNVGTALSAANDSRLKIVGGAVVRSLDPEQAEQQ